MNRIKHKSVYLLLFIYIFIGALCFKLTPNVYSYAINPLFLLLLAFYSAYEIGDARLKTSKVSMQNMLIVMLLFFIFYEFIGLILGFLRNPYSLNFISIIKNIWRVIVPIICIEYIRSLLVNTNEKNMLGLFLSLIIIMFVELNVYTIASNMVTRERGFIFVCSILIPTFAYQVIYTYLSLKGSYKLVLVERLIYQSIFLFVPILPNLDWFGTGIVGIVFPTVIYLAFKFHFDKKARYVKRTKLKKKNPVIFIPIFIVIIIMAGFMIGVFNYSPLAIASNSMNPLFYRGDAVVLRKVDEKVLKNLQIDDIIIFRMDSKVVIHRIIEITEEKGIRYFRTKGDNNETPDSGKRIESDILGVYEFHVKYVGYPSIWLSEFFKHGK